MSPHTAIKHTFRRHNHQHCGRRSTTPPVVSVQRPQRQLATVTAAQRSDARRSISAQRSHLRSQSLVQTPSKPIGTCTCACWCELGADSPLPLRLQPSAAQKRRPRFVLIVLPGAAQHPAQETTRVRIRTARGDTRMDGRRVATTMGQTARRSQSLRSFRGASAILTLYAFVAAVVWVLLWMNAFVVAADTIHSSVGLH